mmetsp:Transcript_39921/g.55498  ORF Transcript_39921/g.55498 Transcript_39921/m.55498 type:complete len:280 (+) Transcript_39921:212-1051(+)
MNCSSFPINYLPSVKIAHHNILSRLYNITDKPRQSGLPTNIRACANRNQTRLYVKSQFEAPLPAGVGAPPTGISILPPIRRSLQEVDLDSCETAYIDFDNELDKDYTTIFINVLSFPGLVRMIAWVLTGLEVEVHKASLRTSPETGMAENRLLVSDIHGKKLSDSRVEDVVDRLTSYVLHCTPTSEAFEAVRFEQGGVRVDNSAHEAYTVMSISAAACDRHKLLEVVSTITGVGLSITEADIDGDVATLKWKFLLVNSEGHKLTYVEVSALLYAMTLTL